MISNVAITPKGDLVYNYVPLELDQKFDNYSQHVRSYAGSALCSVFHLQKFRDRKEKCWVKLLFGVIQYKFCLMKEKKVMKMTRREKGRGRCTSLHCNCIADVHSEAIELSGRLLNRPRST